MITDCLSPPQIPRPGGIRKGWLRQFVAVCDFKLFLHDVSPDRPTQASVTVNQVIDMRYTVDEITPIHFHSIFHFDNKKFQTHLLIMIILRVIFFI